MKQKRTFITLVLIIAILCLGAAYAAITSQVLTITGNVSASITANIPPFFNIQQTSFIVESGSIQ